jgi:hypothetical protein
MSPSIPKKINWSPEDKARHKAIREKFKNWHPSPEELIASGEAGKLGLHVVCSPTMNLLP